VDKLWITEKMISDRDIEQGKYLEGKPARWPLQDMLEHID